jgi:hypothetical protein
MDKLNHPIAVEWMEDADQPIAACVYGAAAELLTPETVAEVRRTVRNKKTGEVIGAHSAEGLTVADVVLETPRTDAGWDARNGEAGFNFMDVVPRTAVATPGLIITVAYRITEVGGAQQQITFEGPILANRY